MIQFHKGNFNTISSNYHISQNIEYFWKKEMPKILSFDIGDYELLGNICYISVGMVANANEKIAKGEFKKDDLISESYSEINNKKYVEGKLISRYKIEKIKYFEWGTDRSPKRLRRPTFPELYEGKKIMRGRMVDGIIDVNNIMCNHTIVVFKKFIDISNITNKSIVGSITKKNQNFTRVDLEELSINYKYEYLFALINSKFAKEYFNVVRREKIKNMFYPDDFRKLPIKALEDQTIFVNIVNILQFLYQYGGNKEIIDFFDNKLLNFMIYEIYFEDKLKEAGYYQDLLKEIKDKIVEIEYGKWIKLKFKSPLNDEEQDEKNRIETKNIEIINEIYNSVNTESVNNKIENMKEFDWIKKVEIT